MTTQIDEQLWMLDATDRCDKCAAQAYIKVIGKTGELLFCGHHYNNIVDNAAGYEKIMNFMIQIIDERKRLEE